MINLRFLGLNVFELLGVGTTGIFGTTNYLTYQSLKQNSQIKDLEFSPLFTYHSQIRTQVINNNSVFVGEGKLTDNSHFKYQVEKDKWSYQLGYSNLKLTLEKNFEKL